MAYILQKGNEYCCLDSRNKIHRTQDIGFATRFTDINRACGLLCLARKKLKGFRVIDLDSGIAAAGIHAAKRKKFSEPERVAIYNRCKGRCGICGKFVPFDVFTVDHIIPLEKGGTNAMENLQCAHSWCNLIKHNASMEELMVKLVEIVLYQVRMMIGDAVERRAGIFQKHKAKILDTINGGNRSH